MIFSRLTTAGMDLAALRHDLVEHAVHAVADAHVPLLRLDVDVRGAVADRLADERVDELDDRRVVDDGSMGSRSRRRRP
jgi:hypothetical protein